MSRFNQRTQAAVAASAEADFYVNVYKDAHGNIRPGFRVYRKEANARRKARSDEGNLHVGVQKFTVKLP